jgi:hypothetical protein
VKTIFWQGQVSNFLQDESEKLIKRKSILLWKINKTKTVHHSAGAKYDERVAVILVYKQTKIVLGNVYSLEMQ